MTTTANPYAAPSAADIGSGESTYEPQVFSFAGRIGRLRYLAYGLAWSFAIMAGAALLGGVLSVVSGSATLVGGLMLLMYGAMLVPTFAMAVRRLNDLNYSGWLSLLMIVPFVNFIVALILIFAPGSSGENNYGPAPGPNSTGVVVAALIMPVVAVIGIVAAIALPAYQDYVTRAQATQVQQLD
ncbi:MAG: DUF805 domain-containing protein [Cellvibrionaceae bacterium]